MKLTSIKAQRPQHKSLRSAGARTASRSWPECPGISHHWQFCTLAILLVSLAVAIQPVAARAQSVTASFPNVSAEAGAQNVEVPILVSTTSGLGIIAADVELEYDSQRFTYNDASAIGTISEAWSSPIVNATIAGNIRMAMYGVSELSGAGTLIKILFDVKADAPAGSSTLVLVKCRFNDGQSISTTLVNGTFTVTGDSATPTPTATPSPSPSTPPPLPTPTTPGYFDLTPTPLPGVDLAVKRLRGPKNAAGGSKFNVRVAIDNHTSIAAVDAVLTVSIAPVKRSAKRRRIGKLGTLSIPANGRRAVSVQAKLPARIKRGDYLLSAEVLGQDDPNPGNNRLVSSKVLRVGY